MDVGPVLGIEVAIRMGSLAHVASVGGGYSFGYTAVLRRGVITVRDPRYGTLLRVDLGDQSFRRERDSRRRRRFRKAWTRILRSCR